MLLEVYFFLHRAAWWTWIGVAVFWALGLAILIPNVLGFGEQAGAIWSAVVGRCSCLAQRGQFILRIAKHASHSIEIVFHIVPHFYFLFLLMI